jgi:hypothetical protein
MSVSKYSIMSFAAGVSVSTIVYYLYNKYSNKYSKKTKCSKCSKRSKRVRHSVIHAKPVASELPKKIESFDPINNVANQDIPDVKIATEEPHIKDDIFNAILMMADQKIVS